MFIFLYNHDYRRIPIFNQLNLHCTLDEECTSIGRHIAQIQSIKNTGPPIKPALMQIVLSSIINETVLPISSVYFYSLFVYKRNINIIEYI